jgi:hypothetical protein
MTIRVVLGAGWTLTVGLAGGWLMLSPWALGQQPSGKDWTSVTQTEFFTGLGLVVLAVLGAALVGMQAIRGLRQTGVLAGGAGRSRAGAQAARGPGSGAEAGSEEFESALVSLAQALTRELQPAPDGRPEGGAHNDQAHAPRRLET